MKAAIDGVKADQALGEQGDRVEIDVLQAVHGERQLGKFQYAVVADQEAMVDQPLDERQADPQAAARAIGAEPEGKLAIPGDVAGHRVDEEERRLRAPRLQADQHGGDRRPARP